jgi:hypothetical protein
MRERDKKLFDFFEKHDKKIKILFPIFLLIIIFIANVIKFQTENLLVPGTKVFSLKSTSYRILQKEDSYKESPNLKISLIEKSTGKEIILETPNEEDSIFFNKPKTWRVLYTFDVETSGKYELRVEFENKEAENIFFNYVKLDLIE